MKTIKVDTLGATTFWAIPFAEIEHEKVEAAFEAAGLKEFAPPAPRDSKALRRAVGEVTGKRTLGRPLARGRAWAVVHERAVGEEDLEHEVTTRARLEKAEDGRAALMVEGDEAGVIREGYERQKGMQRSRDLQHAMAQAVGRLNGVALRDRGGVYFIPAVQAEKWERLSAVIEGLVPHARVYRLSAIIDEQAIRAVLDAVVAEAEQEIQRVAEEIQATGDDALGPRGLQSRVDRVDALRAKVASYEGLLGQSLPAVQDSLDKIRALAAEAAAQAEADAA